MVYQDIKQLVNIKRKRDETPHIYLGGNLFCRNHLGDGLASLPYSSVQKYMQYLLADKVVHRTKDSNSTGGESDQLPGEVAPRVLLVGTEAEACADHGCDSGIGKEDRIAGISTDTTALHLVRLCLLLLFLVLGLVLLGFALYPLRLGGGLDILLEEVGLHSLHMGTINVDQRGRALGFIVVDSTHRGSAAGIYVSCV